ncbi:MlaD family protein [Rhodococcus chondri]|uniref:MlaD family protein n=1 Tax=Rhodococcus chondri TaxID=3065941 RepID=A0ABU7JV48_9NOCA|nr:MlaD family protein [Rhodococcus sp. CC-R104]MEE2033896.1 MlaD family protein [Rhodococcus sp. CC-R104]
MSRWTGRAVVVAWATVAAVSTAACSVGLEELPLPAPGLGGASYTLTATFDNALNLPTKAKVKLAGADIGEVESMAVRDYQAVVTMRIAAGVVVPVGAGAELRSATPLGDVFVALQPPARDEADPERPEALADGDNIPASSTSAAATIEELLSTASVLVNGGALRNLTKIANGLGAAVDGRGDRIAGLLDESARLVGLLGERSEAVEQSLVQTDRLIATLSERKATLHEVVSAAGPALDVIASDTAQVVDLIDQVDRISRQLGRFPAVDGTDTRGMVADINRIAAELNNAATAPEADLEAVNSLIAPIMKVTNGTSAHVDADWEQLILGATPSPGHPGDPGSRQPETVDWENMVGALTYTLLRLQTRVTGAGR